MKLLLDFNLSPKLIPILTDLFPGSTHVRTLGFDGETADEVLWDHAREEGFAVLTSDRDFVDMGRTVWASAKSDSSCQDELSDRVRGRIDPAQCNSDCGIWSGRAVRSNSALQMKPHRLAVR